MNKTELKSSALWMFNKTHKDNKTKPELLRCVMACNGDYMASTGVQLPNETITAVYQELSLQLFKD